MNYVYLLWALFYEAVLVVLVPVALSELLFRDRRADPWLRHPSAIVVGAFFLLACISAWYLWTHIARTLVFNVPVYNAPAVALAIAASVEVILLVLAIGPGRRSLSLANKPMAPGAAVVVRRRRNHRRCSVVLHPVARVSRACHGAVCLRLRPAERSNLSA